MNHKVKSFTLSELLVTLVITVIVVGLAFTVLNLVQKQFSEIETNYSKKTELAYFKQCLWLDFNNSNVIVFNADERILLLKSDLDTLHYFFKDGFIVRNTDTLKVNITIDKLYFQGNETKEGKIDALAYLGVDQNYHGFVFKNNDATIFMN